MKKLKYFTSLIIIFLLTFSVIMVPEITSLSKALTRKSYNADWVYKASTSSKLSKEQFAVLYRTDAVAVNPLSYESYFTSDREKIIADVEVALKEFFQSDDEISQYFCEIIEEDDISYHEKYSALTLFQDEMMALKFTDVGFYSGIELVYEEKTGVVTDFCCIVSYDKSDAVMRAAETYFTDILDLSGWNYYYKEITDDGLMLQFGINSRDDYVTERDSYTIAE